HYGKSTACRVGGIRISAHQVAAIVPRAERAIRPIIYSSQLLIDRLQVLALRLGQLRVGKFFQVVARWNGPGIFLKTGFASKNHRACGYCESQQICIKMKSHSTPPAGTVALSIILLLGNPATHREQATPNAYCPFGQPAVSVILIGYDQTTETHGIDRARWLGLPRRNQGQR